MLYLCIVSLIYRNGSFCSIYLMPIFLTKLTFAKMCARALTKKNNNNNKKSKGKKEKSSQTTIKTTETRIRTKSTLPKYSVIVWRFIVSSLLIGRFFMCSFFSSFFRRLSSLSLDVLRFRTHIHVCCMGLIHFALLDLISFF